MPKNNINTIADILASKEFEPINKTIIENEVLKKFGEIFPDLKKIAKAVKINNKILFLRVQNSVWRSELNLHKTKMIETVNKKFNKKIIENIRFI